jgi:hypothetical protein
MQYYLFYHRKIEPLQLRPLPSQAIHHITPLTTLFVPSTVLGLKLDLPAVQVPLILPDP